LKDNPQLSTFYPKENSNGPLRLKENA